MSRRKSRRRQSRSTRRRLRMVIVASIAGLIAIIAVGLVSQTPSTHGKTTISNFVSCNMLTQEQVKQDFGVDPFSTSGSLIAPSAEDQCSYAVVAVQSGNPLNVTAVYDCNNDASVGTAAQQLWSTFTQMGESLSGSAPNARIYNEPSETPTTSAGVELTGGCVIQITAPTDMSQVQRSSSQITQGLSQALKDAYTFVTQTKPTVIAAVTQ